MHEKTIIYYTFIFFIVFLLLFKEFGIINVEISNEATRFTPTTNNSFLESSVTITMGAQYYMKDSALKGTITVIDGKNKYVDSFYCESLTPIIFPGLVKIGVPFEDDNDHYSTLLYLFLPTKNWCIVHSSTAVPELPNQFYVVKSNNDKQHRKQWFNVFRVCDFVNKYISIL